MEGNSNGNEANGADPGGSQTTPQEALVGIMDEETGTAQGHTRSGGKERSGTKLHW